MLSGRPGAGKTILSNQVAFAHARAGGSVVYATLLAESHARMIAQLSALSFFDPALIGPKFKYLSAYEAITEGGLESLLKVLQGSSTTFSSCGTSRSARSCSASSP